MRSPDSRRVRRTSAEIRALLIDAARDLFLEHGYEATTTRQIANRAGVSEALLFSNFGTKASLFELAVLAPIERFVADYVAAWETTDSQRPEQRVDAFVRGLYPIAQQHRVVLLAALAQRLQRPPDDQSDVLDRLARIFQGLHGASDLDRYRELDPPATVTAALGMILGVALLDALLFPVNTRRPSRDRLITEMEQLLFFGVTGRATPNQRNALGENPR